MEIWKEIPAYGNHYEASNLGNIRVKDKIIKKRIHSAGGKIANQFYKGKVLKQFFNATGYKMVRFGFDGKKYSSQVGRLVLLAFVGRPERNELCCHNDSNPKNNKIENLRWGTQKDNMKDRMSRGKYLKAEKHFMAKLSNKEVMEIYNSDDLGIFLAKKYNTSPNTISRIRNGKLWKSITGGVDRKIGKNYIGKRSNDKFTVQTIKEIRDLRNETGMFYKEIAKKYNTSDNVISKICTRKSWKHVF